MPRATERPFSSHAVGLAFLAALAWPTRAAAQQQPAPVAEQLFLEARALMKAGQYEQACEKLKASYELDRTATGTLLNLGLCHEQTHRTASAWAEFRQVAAQSLDKRADRVAEARQHEARLKPILSYLKIDVPPEARLEGLTLRIDGGPTIAEPIWSTELPIDPGKHVLEMSAPGHDSQTREVVIGATADHQAIVVPVLSATPVAPPIEAPPIERPTPQDNAATTQHAGSSTTTVVGWLAGGVGLATIGVGLAFGIGAGHEDDKAAALCPNDRCATDADRQRANERAASANDTANVANVLVGAGAVLAIGGAILVLVSRPASSASPRPSSATTFFLAPGGMVARGTF